MFATTVMPKEPSRPSLPASSTDFALPPSSAASYDDSNLILQRFRRPSLLAPRAAHFSDTNISFASSKLKEERTGSFILDDPFTLRSDSSQSSGSETATPPLGSEEDNPIGRLAKSKSLITPPRRASSANIESQDTHQRHRRRLSHPLKMPRILNLLAESRPVENEVKSEAAFQRLISGAELSTVPRAPRPPSDRGRYPEEVGDDDAFQREESPSDDDHDFDDVPFAYCPSSSTEPISIPKSSTPGSSVNGDEFSMCYSESSGYGNVAMDVDMPSGSPSLSNMSSTPVNQWRYTPPPTTSAIRSNKRKFDDRYDPYGNATKRRAVSPSVSILREPHPNLGSPITRSNPRLPIAIPITIPSSTASSTTSSPTISASAYSRPVAMTSSPTLRASIGLSSPILRPLVSRSRRSDDEKEIDGAGEAVGGLSLG